MRKRLMAGLILGLALLLALIAWQGLAPFMAAFRELGWQLLVPPLFFLLPVAMTAESWRWLFPAATKPGFALAWFTTWIGLAANWLLPVAQVGGEMLRVHLLVRRGYEAVESIASVVGDKTLQVASLLVFGGLGALLFLQRKVTGDLLLYAFVGLALMGMALVLFYRVQHRGLFGRSARLLERIRKLLPVQDLRAGAEAVDQALRDMYQRRKRLLWAFGWRLLFRLTWTLETWWVLNALGYPLSLSEAIILESLTQLVRAAAFMIPAGIGAQDGAVVLLALALGVPAEAGAGLALAKRVRELVVGLPALLTWQAEETGHLWRRHPKREER